MATNSTVSAQACYWT